MLQHPDVNGPRGEKGLTPNMGIGAYDAASGHLAWYTELPGQTSAGSLVTAGDVVFQAVDRVFYGLDARTGKQVFRYARSASLGASPMTYQAKGTQFVVITSGNAVFAFGLATP